MLPSPDSLALNPGYVPATLQGAATALAYVRLLHERDEHPMLDDFHC